MPKEMTVVLRVPSNSRAHKLMIWLNRLLNPYGTSVTSVTDGDRTVTMADTPVENDDEG